jgi:hypothetical protein
MHPARPAAHGVTALRPDARAARRERVEEVQPGGVRLLPRRGVERMPHLPARPVHGAAPLDLGQSGESARHPGTVRLRARHRRRGPQAAPIAGDRTPGTAGAGGTCSGKAARFDGHDRNTPT